MRARCHNHRPGSLPTHIRGPEDALRVFEVLTEGVVWKQLMMLILDADRRGRVAATFDELCEPARVEHAMDAALAESSLTEGRYVVLGSYRPIEGSEPNPSDRDLYFDLAGGFGMHGLTMLDWFILDADRWCSVGGLLDQPWPWT